MLDKIKDAALVCAGVATILAAGAALSLLTDRPTLYGVLASCESHYGKCKNLEAVVDRLDLIGYYLDEVDGLPRRDLPKPRDPDV